MQVVVTSLLRELINYTDLQIIVFWSRDIDISYQYSIYNIRLFKIFQAISSSL